MHRVPMTLVSLAALLLIAAAGLGLFLGYSRATAAPGGALALGAESSTPAAVSAKTASPIPDSAPPPPVPDETFIRKIAREEVQAALHPKRAAPVADDSADDSDDSSDPDPGAPPQPQPVPPPQPPPPPQ